MMTKPHILISSGFSPATLAFLQAHWEVTSIDDPEEALAFLRGAEDLPLAVVIGLVGNQWPQSSHADYDGLRLPAHLTLDEIQRLDRDLPVIVSTRRRHPTAIVEMIKRGSFDYIVEEQSPPDPRSLSDYNETLQLALQRAVQWRQTILENRRLRQDLGVVPDYQPIQARSPVMLQLLDLVRKVAPTPASVLITGESGVGKEVIARLIHTLSPRRQAPFVAINCGAMTETLLNSELFGHLRGAFTGADRDQPGLIRQADGGTLLLDEIASISSGLQVALLRLLENRQARPVGGREEYLVQCRFIAASNRRLEPLVQEGTFRQDLYYRLNVFHLHVPPLRERRDDIPMLAYRFLQQTAASFGKDVVSIEPGAMAVLERHAWPGNVRELRNAIERAVILCESSRIRPADLVPLGDPRQPPVASITTDYQHAMSTFERDLLRRALRRAGGNISAAARELGMKRTTLTHRLKTLELRWQPPINGGRGG